MRKIYSLFMGLLLMGSSAAMAQSEGESSDTPTTVSGFYRLTNPGFGDAISVNGRYEIACGEMKANNAGNIIEIETGSVWSFVEYVRELDAMLAAGKITEEEYSTLFQQSMTVDGWKGGFYPVTKFRCQGVDYVPMIKKLADYCDDAIEAYLNDEIPTIYEKYRNKLTLLCIFATDVIKPADLESVDTFRAWAEGYLAKWRSIADFNMYLQTVYSEPVNDTDPLVPTGEYYITFKTPVWVGNMKQAQTYINNMVFEDGTAVDDEKLDLWGDSKVRIMRALAKDYPEGSAAYKFVEGLLGQCDVSTQYVIGENEDGSLYSQPLPDTFGTNGVVITADDIAKCTWMFRKVDEAMPFAVQPNVKHNNGTYYTTLYTDFPYEIKSAGTKAYTIGSLGDDASFEGSEGMKEIVDGKVPAHTPVVIKSLSGEMKDNVMLPLAEEVAPIDCGLLDGTCFARPNGGHMCTLALNLEGAPTFCSPVATIPANTAYVNHGEDAINAINLNTTQTEVYDLKGIRLQNASKKGVYVVNGKKVVR